MKFEFNFSPLPDYVLIKTEGEPSIEDIESLFKALVDSPNWKPGTKQLYDHRKSILRDFSSDGMRRMADITKKYGNKLGRGSIALIVKGSLGYGLGRMYQMLGGEQVHAEVGIFYSIEEAVEWLKKQ